MVKEFLVDGQFQASRTALAELQINLNCVYMDEYAPEAARLIWTLKKRYRCSMYNTLFPKLQKCMVIGLLQNVIFYLNAFPDVDVVSDLSPLTIVQEKITYFGFHCQVEFEAYANKKPD